MDRMMVLQSNPSKKEYISLEGNRRTAALQLLSSPELLNDLVVPDYFRSKMTDLAEDFDKATVEPIKCVLMPDRESARRWIELRHTGENNGRGIVDWNGVQTARFRGDKTLELLDFIKAHGDLTEDEFNSVQKAFPITTLDRLVSNPAVRQKLGLQIIDGKFHSEYKGTEIVPALKRIILDLSQKKVNVTAVKTSDQQKKYIESLPKKIIPKGQKLPAPVEVAKSIQAKAKPSTPKPTPVPTPPSPLSRKTLIPKGLALSIANQKASQIVYELRTINIERHPIAGAMLLRALIEAGVGVYGAKHGLPTHHTKGKNVGKAFSLSEKLTSTINHLHTSGALTKQQRTAATNTLVAEKSVISVSRLHEYVHNPDDFPSRKDLISGWSGAEPFVAAVFK